MGPASFAQAPAGATCRTKSAVRRRRARKGTPRHRLRGSRRREPPARERIPGALRRGEGKAPPKHSGAKARQRCEGRRRKCPEKARKSRAPEVAGPGRARQRRPRARGAAGPRREDGRRRGRGEGHEEERPEPPYRAAPPDERASAPSLRGAEADNADRSPAHAPGMSDRDGGGATGGDPTTKQDSTAKQAGRTQTSPRRMARAARANGREQPAGGVGPKRCRNQRGQAAPARRHLLPGMSRHRATGKPSPGRSARAGLIHFPTRNRNPSHGSFIYTHPSKYGIRMQHYPARHHALHSRYNPESGLYTQDRYPQ